MFCLVLQGEWESIAEAPVDFLLTDIFEFVTSGIELIVNDQVTQRFVAEDLKVNLTNNIYSNPQFHFHMTMIDQILTSEFFIP